MNRVASLSLISFKKINNLIFLGAITAFILIYLLSNQSISAQIAEIYSPSEDKVAGITSLMTAAANNDIDGAKFFSKAGPAMINQRNFGGATALHIASRENGFDIAKILIENGADVNIADNEGWTPLMRAARNSDENLVNLLLENGANASFLNSVGESAIIHATMSDCDKCISTMLEKFNFVKSLDNATLTQQINDSYNIARNHENSEIQKILGEYLEKVAKINSLLEPQQTNLENIDNQATNQQPQAILTIESSESGKKFKFAGSSKNKIDKIEVVEPISIQKEQTINITEEKQPVKEAVQESVYETINPSEKKSYKFLGQSGSSTAVQNYESKVKELLQKDSANSQENKDAKIEALPSKKTYKFLSSEKKVNSVENANSASDSSSEELSPSKNSDETSQQKSNGTKTFKFKKQ